MKQKEALQEMLLQVESSLSHQGGSDVI